MCIMNVWCYVKTRICVAVHCQCRCSLLVSLVGDAVVDPDLEALDLGTIHALLGLLGVLDTLEVDEGETPGPLAGPVQHNVHLASQSS